MSPSDEDRGWRTIGPAAKRVLAASQARRQYPVITETPSAPPSNGGEDVVSPRMALLMEAQLAILRRVDAIEQERLYLPAPTDTFGPSERGPSRHERAECESIQASIPAQPMEVEDLLGESSMRPTSLRRRRLELEEEKQLHYDQYAQAQKHLAELATAQELQQVVREREYKMAQERLRGVEEGLMGEAKDQHHRRAALEHQAAQREAELVAQELRIQQDREELNRLHSNRLRELHERELKLQQEKEKMVRESERQKELEAALASQVRRVQDARNAVGLERAEMKLSREDLDERIRVATEEAYRRGKADGVRTAQRTVEMELSTRTSGRDNTRPRTTTDPGPQPLAESTLKETKVPLAKNCKLNLRYFNGAELYKGLGAGFKPWSVNFKQQVDLAERACGHRWPEEVKISVLGSYLRGNAENYFDGMKDQWWECKPTVQYALEEMEQAFNRTFTSAQINKLMMKPKAPSTTWYEHLLYLMAVANATHAPLSHVPEHLVFHADEEMAKTLSTLYDKDAKSPIRHANELAVFAQNFEDNMKKSNKPGKLAAAVQNETENREDTRSCQICHKSGHTAKVCISKGSKGSEPSGNCKSDGDQNNARWGFSGLLAGDVTCEDWILDSGASTHLVRNADALEDWTEEDDPNGVLLPDGSTLRTTRRGTLKLRVSVDGEYFWITFKNACYAPGLAVNLISFGVLLASGCSLELKGGQYAIVKNGDTVMHVQLKNNVLVLDRGVPETKVTRLREVFMAAIRESESPQDTVLRGSLHEFHVRFGHLNYDDIERMARDAGNGLELTDKTRRNCLSCAEGKQARTTQPKKDSGANAPIDVVGAVVCSDLKGPITPMDRHKNRYMINFIDHKTSFCRVFVAKTKDKAADKFKHFMVYFERTYNVRVHVLRTDGGGEYKPLDMFCARTGIARQVTEPHTSASNGKAERLHRTIMNMVRCMLFGCGLPLNYWGYAAEYAAYVLNRMPTRANVGRKPPLEMLTGKPVNVTDIVAFGSPCTVYANPKKTLDRRGTAGIIVGKNEETKGYKVIVVKDNVVVTTRHVGNIETLSSEANEQLQAVLEREAENDLEALASRRQEERNARETSSQNLTAGRPTTGKSIRANAKQKKSVKGIGGELRRSGRQRKKSQRQREADGDSVQHASDKLDNAGTKVVMSALKHVLVMSAIGAGEEQYRHLPDPKSYRAAMQMPDAHLWQMAFDEEVNSLEANKTWEPVITPDDANVIYSKSVYKKKIDGDGKIGRYKVRIVAGGDKQVLGRDYEMTFSAVLDLTSGKIILAVAHIWKVRAKHYDVPNAYVRAFKEPQFQIYMRIPEGMKLSREQLRRLGVSDQIRVCLRLVKSLYGLKQAGRLWNRLLHETLTNDAGMIQSATDACVYYNITSRGTTLVGVYVDDLLATATSEELLTEFEHNMKSMELKVGLAENFLGMRISYDEQTGYAVDAEHTIVDLLGKFGLQKANAVRVPIADESTLEAEAGNDELLPEHGSGTPERPTRQMFQSLVGSLLWLVRTTRPDAMYAVHRATRRSHAPTLQDWKMAKRIMRYLAGTASLKLHLGSGINTKDVVVSAYTDADYAADKQSRKSVSGSVILVNGMTVGWLVKQQTSVALSTAEAEFVAAAVGYVRP